VLVKPFQKKVHAKPNLITVGRAYEAINRPAAEAVLENPLEYRGALREWALLWMRNHPAPAKRREHVRDKVMQRSLF
jgi:hypothetical protein